MFSRLASWLGYERKSVDLTALLDAASSTAAGIAVSPTTALRCAPLLAAVRAIAESVAQLPIHLYRRLPNGGRERAGDHPLQRILHDHPCDWLDAAAFRLRLTWDGVVHGRGVAHVGRAGDRVAELVPVDPRALSVHTDPVTLEPTYRLALANGATREYGHRDLLVIEPLPGGLSPVALGREAIGLSLILETYGAGLFGRGARPSGVVRVKRHLGPEAQQRLRQSFDASFAGGKNSGRTLVLEDDVTFEAHQLSSVDAQYLELRRFQVLEIARLLRIPPHMLAELDRATHNNAEHLGQQFLTYTLAPYLKLWQGSINRVLLTEDEQREYYCEFLVDDLVRADIGTRFAAYATGLSAGFLAANEVRERENMGPLAGGDVLRAPLNTAPAEDAVPAKPNLRVAS